MCYPKEIPRHRALGKSVDPEKVLEKAAGILNCDLDYIRHSRRIPKLINDLQEDNYGFNRRDRD